MFNRLYIHLPFCIEKCNYCSFISGKPEKAELEEYPGLLLQELKIHAASGLPVDSVYFGGGTPSLIHPEQLALLLDEVARQIGIADRAEITLETNPGSVNFSRFMAFREIGINRISLGVQSFDDRFLQILGRIHTASESRQAFLDARRAGFRNISVDLMHSLPGQTLDEWRTELLQAVRLEPEHISIYGLTIEAGTPFASSYPPDSPDLADEDLAAEMFELSDEILRTAGFEHYEIANYARPGYRGEHNCGYWKRDGCLGLGVGAHSFMRRGHGVRFANPGTLDEYRRGLASGAPFKIDEYKLNIDDAMGEYMFLGLRLAEGVNTNAFEREFGHSLDAIYGTAAADLVNLGLLKQKDDNLALTLRGMLLSNQVFARFLL